MLFKFFLVVPFGACAQLLKTFSTFRPNFVVLAMYSAVSYSSGMFAFVAYFVIYLAPGAPVLVIMPTCEVTLIKNLSFKSSWFALWLHEFFSWVSSAINSLFIFWWYTSLGDYLGKCHLSKNS